MDTTEDLFFLLFLLSYTVDCAVHRTVGFFVFKQSTEYLVMCTDQNRTSFMKIQNRHVFEYTGFVSLYHVSVMFYRLTDFQKVLNSVDALAS